MPLLKKILLVEDNPDDEFLCLRALKKHHIANGVLVAHDGAEALDMLHGDADPPIDPAVVLLDVNLPKVNGIEVLREMRANKKTAITPVVMLTTSREEQDMIDSYHLGANSYIIKPVDFKQFSDAIKEIGLYWLVLNEYPLKT